MQNFRTRSMAFTALFVTLTIISAKISVPLPFLTVAFTAQTCVVLCAGLLLGPRYGALSQAIYLALGLIGLPIFSLGGGPGYVMLAPFAYLISFPFAAAVSGWVAQRKPQSSVLWHFFAALCGVVTIYIIALPALWVQSQLFSKQLPAMGKFLQNYCLIFLPMDIVKALLAAVIAHQASKRLR